MLLVSTEVIEEAKIVEKCMLPKGLAITLSKRVITIMLCLPRVPRLSIRESVELSIICEETKI